MLLDRLCRVYPDAAAIGLDIETTGLSFWKDTPTVISLSDGKSAIVIDLRKIAPDKIGAWLKNEVYAKHQVIAHNGQFDFTFLDAAYDCGYPPNHHDTLLADKLLMAGAGGDIGFTLQDVAKRRLGIWLEKDKDIRTGFSLDAVFTLEQIEYSEKDALYLPRIAAMQEAEIKANGLLSVWQIECGVLKVFCGMEKRGIKLDVPMLKALLAETQIKVDKVKASL